MAEYNSPIAVGLAQPSPMIPVTKWAPVTVIFLLVMFT